MYLCPVTREGFDGSHPFVVIWSTGKVISMKALKEMGIEALQAEYGPFEDTDLVRLLPQSEAEITEQKAKMTSRQAARAAAANSSGNGSGSSSKKNKKRTAPATDEEMSRGKPRHEHHQSDGQLVS